jgi:L-malate glycosyltransferase
LLEVYSGKYFIIADVVSRVCNILGLHLIMILHGGGLPTFVRAFPNWTRRTLRRAQSLVAPSGFIAHEIGLHGFTVRVIPNVINLHEYTYCERSKIFPKLLWMRSFHAIYNPEMAIKVLARLRMIQPQATLTLAGKDKGLEDNLKMLSKQLGVDSAVRFVGFLDMKAKLEEMSDADIYLNTNRVDNMPVSVIEARAMGLPVVATNVGGLPFVIEHGIDGLLVKDNDVEGMVTEIVRLLSDPELARQISTNGRIVAEQSGWDAVRPEWEDLISEILDVSKNRVPVRAVS